MGWIEKLKFETTDLLCGLNKANVNFGDVEDCGFLDWIGLDFHLFLAVVEGEGRILSNQ